MIPRFKEGNILVYIFKSFGNSIDVNIILNPVELPESGVMVVVPMGPDHSIYTGKVLLEELLSEVRAGVDKDFTLIGLYKDRRTKALTLSTVSGILAGRAVASNFRSSDSIAGPKQC